MKRGGLPQGRREPSDGTQTDLRLNPESMPSSSYVTLGRLLYLSESQFPPGYNGDGNSYLIGLPWR